MAHLKNFSQYDFSPLVGRRLRRHEPTRRLPRHDWQQVDHQQVGAVPLADVQATVPQDHRKGVERGPDETPIQEGAKIQRPINSVASTV